MFVVLAFLAGCVGRAGPPGMRAEAARPHPSDASLVELARVEPHADGRALLVVHPRTACSGSASTVFVDDAGRFVGAVAPGTAALVEVSAHARELLAISSVELDAPLGMWSVADRVRVPAPPSGLLLESWKWNSRVCGNGHYADVHAATKGELEDVLGREAIPFFTPSPREGQAWVAARRDRVAEVLAADRAYRASLVRGPRQPGFPAGPLPAVDLGPGWASGPRRPALP